MIFLSILTFILILMVVVFIHELGHFLAARRNGVLVEEFGIGMPPRAIGVQKIHNKWHILRGTQTATDPTKTIYSLNWLPLGGFVRLYGDGAGGEGGSINPMYKKLSLGSASVWARLLIMVAGVIMNILLAIVIYYALLGTRGFVSDRLPLLDDVSFRFGQQIESVGAVAVRPGSPAAKAGIPAESLIRSIRPVVACPNGDVCDPETGWKKISKTTDLIEMVKQNGGKPVEIELQKSMLNPELSRIVVTPEYDAKEKRALIGVQLMKFVSFDYSQTLTNKILSGPMHAYNLMSYNFQIQRTIFAASIKAGDPRIAGEAMGGPVAIARVVGDTVNRSGSDTIRNLLSLTALISLSLAFMNILPIPALDGGRVALLIPEMITGRKINKKFESYINIGGFVFLIALSIVITFKDVLNLFR